MTTMTGETRATRGRDGAFVDHLAELARREDRAALAELRRGLGKPPGEAAGMHRHVMPFLPPDAPPWEEEAYYLVAALFALHRGSWGANRGEHPTNFGASYAWLARAAGGVSVEARFVALLNAERDELAYHLRQAISLMRAHEIPVDWLRLLRDVRGWGNPDRWVQPRWARVYWRRADDTPERGPEGGGEGVG